MCLIEKSYAGNSLIAAFWNSLKLVMRSFENRHFSQTSIHYKFQTLESCVILYVLFCGHVNFFYCVILFVFYTAELDFIHLRAQNKHAGRYHQREISE